ncbi:hypothetical protein [Agitococcus lubricus]|uniref:EF-hand domain-containing protein n=1 Tax=Agitococcus lubricus TaxID=1077255 RepID=A0A2T5J289_9GAMM|nr:hypothetical protein [Agitococcus lubricus]PTQ90639.1 hypothetical protein C8N29_10238 [Agitococcus lubricus]
MTHTWRFFRSSGFDQVMIDTVSDLENLKDLDKKLWTALACPTKGLELDARTLTYIDTDGDGRIREPELLAAIDWTLAHLADKEVLFQPAGLTLAAIDGQHPDGAKILAAAQQLLQRLGKANADAICSEDTQDLGKMFPANQVNGDGLIPAALTSEPALAETINDIIVTLGSETDRSGEPAVSAEKIKQFFADIRVVNAWEAQMTDAISPFGQHTASAYDAFKAVAAKIDDYFVRTQLAAFDDKATTALNASDTQFLALAGQLLALNNADTQSLPLAKITEHAVLKLKHGINPAWQVAISQFREQVLGLDLDELTANHWVQIKASFVAYQTWLAAKPSLAVATLDTAKRQHLANGLIEQSLLTLVEDDLQVADAANALVELDKLVRYQANLVTLVNNFISFSDFYSRKEKAIFQAGTLFIDGRACDLTVRVNDMGKHATMAGLSNTYLVYCDCTRKGSPEKMTIVAAVTAGEAGNLMVGRNGVFYDRLGNDWDATVVKLIENAISVNEAFWTPYRRLGRMVSNQLQKMASEQDKAIETKTSENITAGIGKVQEAAKTPVDATKPTSPPVPFDVAKFAGIFAAMGLAVGAIATAIASVVSGFMALIWWQMPLAISGLLLMISGPSMIMAWFKLRQRNLSPILDANGWAVNSSAKVNIAFGESLTMLATLPKGAQRSLKDPFA